MSRQSLDTLQSLITEYTSGDAHVPVGDFVAVIKGLELVETGALLGLIDSLSAQFGPAMPRVVVVRMLQELFRDTTEAAVALRQDLRRSPDPLANFQEISDAERDPPLRVRFAAPTMTGLLAYMYNYQFGLYVRKEFGLTPVGPAVEDLIECMDRSRAFLAYHANRYPERNIPEEVPEGLSAAYLMLIAEVQAGQKWVMIEALLQHYEAARCYLTLLEAGGLFQEDHETNRGEV